MPTHQQIINRLIDRLDENNIGTDAVLPASRALLEHWRSQGLPVPDPIPDGTFNIGAYRFVMTRKM